MTLPQIVTSPELSKRLRELGVPQKSLLYWWCQKGKWGISYSRPHPKTGFRDEPWYSAFTSSELDGIIPDGYFTYRRGNSWFNGKDLHQIAVGVAQDTAVNAKAQILIHLIEQGIIDPKKV